MNPVTALVVSAVLLALNAFFVAAEFAVISAKRHRLEDLAAQGGRAARAALNANRELSLMLAGAQLGITLCTLGLGALAEPALAHLMEPAFELLHVPHGLVHPVSLVLGVGIVVFLHMVVGEMAPKSWAITHPERSAVMLALPFRFFTWLSRPVIWLMNELANLVLRVLRVAPNEGLAEVHGPAELQVLLAQSHAHGVLPDEEHRLLSGALRLEEERVGSFMKPVSEIVSVDLHATAEDVERISRESGRSRLIVTSNSRFVGLVHVRDALQATASGRRVSVATLRQQMPTIQRDLPLIDAAAQMRAQRAQLALVADRTGRKVGLVALEDILEQILGEFDDETDETLVAVPLP